MARGRERLGRGPTTAGRVVLTALLAATVVLSPIAAFASFTSSNQGAVGVATATLSAPPSMSLSLTCPFVVVNGNLKVTFPDVALATSYLVTLVPPSGQTQTRTVTSGSTGASFTLTNRNGTYTVAVVSRVAEWTSPELRRSFTIC